MSPGRQGGQMFNHGRTPQLRPFYPSQTQSVPSDQIMVIQAMQMASPHQLAHTLTFNATRGSDPLWNSSIRAIYDEHQPTSQPDSGNIYLFIQHQAIPILSVFAGQGTVQTSVSCLEASIGFSQSSEAESGAMGGLRASAVLMGLGLLGTLFASM